MLEMILCSMVTILPDYLFRRYAQGRRFGHEITLYSVWFELRWGIIALPDSDSFPDHLDLLLSSIDHRMRSRFSVPCRFCRKAAVASRRSM